MTAGRLGGGVFCESAGARLTHNIVTGNRVSAAFAAGGGVAAENDSSLMPFLILEDNTINNNFVRGGTAGSGDAYSGGADIMGTSVRIVGNVFEGDSVYGSSMAVGGGLSVAGISGAGPFPDAYIHDNIFRANILCAANKGAYGGGVFLQWTGQTEVSENMFEGNIVSSGLDWAEGGGLWIFDGSTSGLTRRRILQNRFLRNRIDGVIGNGGGLNLSNTLATVSGNICADNVIAVRGEGYNAGGGVRAWKSAFRMENNIIAGNIASYGGGIEVAYIPEQGSEQVIINNTVIDNTASTGGGLYLVSGARVVVLNTIFWGNSARVGAEITIARSQDVVSFCNIQHGWPAGTGNISEDPCFMSGDLLCNIQQASCCSGRGVDSVVIDGVVYRAPEYDIDGHPRHHQPGFLNPDIGAQEAHAITSAAARATMPLSFGLSQNYPNPFNPTTTIRYQLPASGNVSLTVYDLLGREVATLVNEMKQPGSYSVQWNASAQPSGIFFYRLEAGGIVQTKKLVILK